MKSLSCKQLLAFMLAAAMIFTIVPFGVFAADNENLALGKTVTVSSYESGTSFDGSKIVDGDRSNASRWGTGGDAGAGEWAEIDLGEATAIQQIDIYFERADADQNILSYQVEFYANETYTTVYTKSERAAQHETIVLEEAQQAEKVKITVLDADGGTMNYVNVGIIEVELYASEVTEDSGDSDVVTDSDNIALGKSATASNVESGTSFVAGNAVDGSTSTRWATDQNVTEPWIEIDLDDGSTVQQINIIFERTDANQNILAFKVEAYANDAYTTIYTHAEADGRCSQREKIVLSEPVTADALKLTITSYDGGQNPVWSSVSVCEIEVYSTEIYGLDDVAQSLTDMAGTVITGDTLTLPEVPDGYTIEMNGADLEQIIGDDLSVYHPLTDKVVNVSFKISDGTDSTVTSDIPVTVQGLYTQDAANNAKPVVIPEIQEWYSDSTAKLAVGDITTVTYDDAALAAVVEEFVSDYEIVTGIKLTAAQGEAQANAFNFSLTAPDAKLGDEGYTMEILSDRINVASVSTTGNMYGMQTILQMYRMDSEGYAVGKMRDYPRFQVRGLLLDMARKPIAMTMISEISRTMRYYKMNDFQLHLSDNLIFLEDYGSYDASLDAYEAFRLESSLTNDAGEDPTAEDYFITKAAMAAFIQSERALGMNIVPEIDVPAHSLSFTKIWPEIRVADTGSNRPLSDHFDLTKPEAVAKIKEIFDDYTKGDFITFDADTTVHIGADEFTYNATSYREYFNEIIPYVKETNTVRVWGSLTIIDDNATEIIPEAIENVQMNIWNTGWAEPQAMYDLGFDVINTIDGSSYMVPSGSYGRGGYGDLLNLDTLFSGFNANVMGSATIPSGDDQMLGAVFAIWNDNIDTRACGLTESDMFYRFFDALPMFAEKTWAATGQEKGSASALTELSETIGVAPGVNPYDQAESVGNTHESYTFDDLTDGSGNGRDLTAGTAAVENGVLTLAGGNSYVTTPIDKIGTGNSLSFDITLTEEAAAGDILFETTPEYGTHDIRILSDGTLGFTRELYEYSFGYTLPVGETVHIEIVAEQQLTTLYVNGEAAGTATGSFSNNGAVRKTDITNSTFSIPLERIGSATNAIAATIDNVTVEALADPADDSRDIPVEVLTATTGDYEPDGGSSEGPANLVLDNDSGTLWHTDWQGTSRENHWIQFELSEGYVVDGLRYQPRQSGSNGTITEYQVQVSNDGTNFETVTSGTWANNTSWKIAEFDGVQAKYVRLVAVNTAGDNASYVFASAAEIRLTGTKADHTHTPGEAVRENEIAATCTADGSYDSVVTCTACGEELSCETVTVPATGHTYENGACVCGDTLGAAYNTATETTYENVAEALEAAEAGQTVLVLTDHSADNVLVTPGVTLDLNGHVLTAAYTVGFNTAHIVDNVGTGSLVTDIKNLVLDEENAMIPVYDGTSYIFAQIGLAIERDENYTGEAVKINAMAYPKNMNVVELLKDGAVDNNIQIMIQLSWGAEDGTRSQTFVFKDEIVAQVYSSNGGEWNQYGKMFTMTITGYESIENLKANVVVISGTNAERINGNAVSIT